MDKRPRYWLFAASAKKRESKLRRITCHHSGCLAISAAEHFAKNSGMKVSVWDSETDCVLYRRGVDGYPDVGIGFRVENAIGL